VPPNILLVRFSAIGDILLLTPLVRALRRKHPDARLTVVTRTGFAPLLERNPRISEVISWDPLTSLSDLGRRLRGLEFTHRLDLHDSVRSRLLRWHAGGPWTTYPKHRLARAALIHTHRDLYRDRRHLAERYFDAARGLGRSRQLIAVAPGAAHFTKRWPTHHWIALVRRLVEAGNDVIVLGGPHDLAIGEAVAAAGGESAATAAGAFDLPGSAALLKRTRALVSGDTGLMHLATAVETPVVALFGPTVEQFGFFPYRAKSAVLQRELSCRPCSAHGGATCPLTHHRCLQDILPADVLEALRKLPR